jgi:hypothetical protein
MPSSYTDKFFDLKRMGEKAGMGNKWKKDW